MYINHIKPCLGCSQETEDDTFQEKTLMQYKANPKSWNKSENSSTIYQGSHMLQAVLQTMQKSVQGKKITFPCFLKSYAFTKKCINTFI